MSDTPTRNRDLFVKDPLSWTIANDGVSSNNVEDLDTLRYELTTFVCEGGVPDRPGQDPPGLFGQPW